MGLDTRDYSRKGRYRDSGGGGGGIGGGFPWSLPLFTVFGIRVRVHLVFILWVVFEMLRARTADELRWEALSIAILFGIILLHEFGHCLACRWVGGTADDVLLWPLGGLATCNPPPNWKAELITVLGGPAVNVILIPILAVVVVAVKIDPSFLIFNPLRPAGSASWTFVQELVYVTYFRNIWLLAFNMLLPMYPMDAGRTLQCILWAFIGRARSLRIAAWIGLITAILVGLWSLGNGGGVLLLIALAGGFTCWSTIQQLRQGWMPDEEAPAVVDRLHKRAVKARQRQADADAELDRILSKIKERGLDSLSGRERKFLERDTRRRRT